MDQEKLREECDIVSEEIKNNIKLLFNRLIEIFDYDGDDIYYGHREYDKFFKFFDEVESLVEPEFRDAFKHLKAFKNHFHKHDEYEFRLRLKKLVDKIRKEKNLELLRKLCDLTNDLVNEFNLYD